MSTAHVQKVELQKVKLQKVEWQKVEQSKGRIFYFWEGRKFSNFYKKIREFLKNHKTAFLGWIQHGEVGQLWGESKEEKNIDWRPEIWI